MECCKMSDGIMEGCKMSDGLMGAYDSLGAAAVGVAAVGVAGRHSNRP